MKLEVGMYVRTKDGEIGKITHIETETFSSPAYTLDIFPQGIYKGCEWFEGKTSNNIIDLIEVGDYVNGSEVTSIEENGWLGFGDNDWYIPNSGGIKSVVTKEQFESIKYSLEG